jgi:hypothetical protein
MQRERRQSARSTVQQHARGQHTHSCRPCHGARLLRAARRMLRGNCCFMCRQGLVFWGVALQVTTRMAMLTSWVAGMWTCLQLRWAIWRSCQRYERSRFGPRSPATACCMRCFQQRLWPAQHAFVCMHATRCLHARDAVPV